MARLTQAKFAKLLREAMEVLDVQNVELGRESGIDQTTISRYRDPDYASGPPSVMRRRILERSMALPEGYLDGGVPADLKALHWQRILKREGAARRVGEDPGELYGAHRQLQQLYPTAMRALAQAAGRSGAVPLAVVNEWVTTIYLAGLGQSVELPATPAGASATPRTDELAVIAGELETAEARAASRRRKPKGA